MRSDGHGVGIIPAGHSTSCRAAKQISWAISELLITGQDLPCHLSELVKP